jgi:hypothetical protein
MIAAGRRVKVMPQMKAEQGITAARTIFGKCFLTQRSAPMASRPLGTTAMRLRKPSLTQPAGTSPSVRRHGTTRLGMQGEYEVQKAEIIGRNGTSFTVHGLRDQSVHNIKSLEGADILWVEDPAGGHIALSKLLRHDWASHGADAFRTAAVMIREPEKKKEQQPRRPAPCRPLPSLD